MREFPIPICGVCGTEVQKISFYRDECDLMLCFKAECHGDTEICRIPEELLAYGFDVVSGTAFKSAQLGFEYENLYKEKR